MSMEYLTVTEAAQQKGVAVSTIYNAIRRGDLSASNVMGRVAITLDALNAYEPGSYAGVQHTNKPRRRSASDVAVTGRE